MKPDIRKTHPEAKPAHPLLWGLFVFLALVLIFGLTP